MTKATISAGVCGFVATVEAVAEGSHCRLVVESDCRSIQRLGSELKSVDPLQEIAFGKGLPLTYQIAVKHCAHAACPVPAGIIKAIEVEAGLALPADVSIRVTAFKEDSNI